MLFLLAYRNLWRNKRRTLITAASIMFAVFFATSLSSIQKGAWDYMVESVVHFYYGYAQIHTAGFWEEQSINKAFIYPDSALLPVEQHPGITQIIPRLENFALASYGTNTKPALLIGTEPEQEQAFTGIGKRITQGRFCQNEDEAVVATGLAEDLGLTIGDTIVFISQGFRGSNAAGKYPLVGIINFGPPELNDRLAYIPLKTAQYFYRADNRVTGLVLGVDDKNDLPDILADLRAAIDTTEYEVLGYEQLMPDLMEAREFDDAGAVIIMFILYTIIAFGIFGTILMMLKEREYEFGILKAIGMKSRHISIVVWIEMTILALLGAAAGMVLAFPVVSYLTTHPIRFTGDMAAAYEKFGMEAVLPATLEFGIFLNQAILVVILVFLMSLYPFVKIKKLKPMRALHH